jgi:hypothetical protein
VLKSTALELPNCLTYSVFTSRGDLLDGIREAEEESTAKHFCRSSFATATSGRRSSSTPTTGELAPDSPAALDAGSVVLAVGGARGITAEIMKTLAEHFRHAALLVATTRLDVYPPEVFEGSDEEFSNRRAEYIRTERAAHPDKNPGQLNREFDGCSPPATRARNLDEMARPLRRRPRHDIAGRRPQPRANRFGGRGILADEGKIRPRHQRARESTAPRRSRRRASPLPVGARPEARRVPEPQVGVSAKSRRGCGATSARSSG